MTEAEKTATQEFHALLPAALRTLQLLQASLFGGVLLFLIVLLALAVQPRLAAPATGVGAGMLNLLTIVHLAVAAAAHALAPMLYNAQLAKPIAGATPRQRAGLALAAIRQASLLRLALLEGPAIFGLVVGLLAVAGGFLREQPLYWVNVLSALAFLGIAALSFPTRDRLEALFAARFAG